MKQGQISFRKLNKIDCESLQSDILNSDLCPLRAWSAEDIVAIVVLLIV